VEQELELALAQPLARVADRLPCPAVPEQHGAAAVLALGDHALEAAILDGMVLGLHGEALVRRVEARPLRHRPAEEDAVELEAEVVVEPPRGVLLDHERVALPAARLPRWLGRAGEVPFAAVFGEIRHRS
jgi:hypothetical protein